MRYAQGGLTPQGQAARKRVRILAAEGFARGEKNAVIARDLRLSVRSVERWRRSRRGGGGGLQALRCSGPARRPKVNDSDFALLERLLLQEAKAHGWPDERWTLYRIHVLIANRLLSLNTRTKRSPTGEPTPTWRIETGISHTSG